MAFGGKHSSLELNVEDNVSILMDCGTEKEPIPVSIHLDYLQRPPVRTCTISGESGRILWDFHGQSVQVWSALSKPTTDSKEPEIHRFDDFQRNQMFIDQFKHFLSAIQGKVEALVPLEEGLKSLDIALAVKQSMISRAGVRLP